MKKSWLFSVAIILLMIILNLLVYSKLPAQVASHWDAQGNVNGYMSKFWGVFLFPILALGMLVLFFVLPRFDPYKKSYGQFQEYYHLFIITIITFFFYIQILTILQNLGYLFNLVTAMLPGFAVLFFVIGMMIGKAQRNWFVGIRTPWTMSSERVWNKTHKLGGKLFKIGAVLSLLGMFFPSLGIFFFFVPLMLIAIFLVGYSYWEYHKEKRS